jgi:hypothetical protein
MDSLALLLYIKATIKYSDVVRIVNTQDLNLNVEYICVCVFIYRGWVRG